STSVERSTQSKRIRKLETFLRILRKEEQENDPHTWHRGSVRLDSLRRGHVHRFHRRSQSPQRHECRGQYFGGRVSATSLLAHSRIWCCSIDRGRGLPAVRTSRVGCLWHWRRTPHSGFPARSEHPWLATMDSHRRIFASTE